MFIERYLKKNRIPRQQCKYAIATIITWMLAIYTVGGYMQIIHDRGNIIPKILHKTSKVLLDDDIQLSFFKECETMYNNDGWDVKLWYDDDIDIFVSRHYPQYYQQFKDITPHIKQVDAIRYLLMYHFGGIYLDMDDECIRPATNFVDGIVKGSTFWMSGYPESHFMMSTRRNKFALFAFELILKDWTKYNVRSTGGPQGLNRMATAYASIHGQDAIRPFTMFNQNECDIIQPHGDVVCGEPTYRWIKETNTFPKSTHQIYDKIGFIPSNIVDPTACLAKINDCRTSHCHDRADVQGSLSVHHCLFSWKDQSLG